MIGGRLGRMILEVFSNHGYSMILRVSLYMYIYLHIDVYISFWRGGGGRGEDVPKMIF